MQVDWVTVAAQIVNFLILVYLLKRFLYQPVVTAMAKREQRIAQCLDDAQKREHEAKTEAAHYRAKTDELEQSRAGLLAGTREDAEIQRKLWLQDARREVAQTSQQWQQQAEREKHDFLVALRRQAAQSIARIAGRVLADLADTTLEQQMVRAFLKRFRSLDETARQALANGPIRIATSFELNEPLRAEVREGVRQCIPGNPVLEFTESSGILCGIQLKAEGCKLDWTIHGYLDTLQEQIEEELAGARPRP